MSNVETKNGRARFENRLDSTDRVDPLSELKLPKTNREDLRTKPTMGSVHSRSFSAARIAGAIVATAGAVGGMTYALNRTEKKAGPSIAAVAGELGAVNVGKTLAPHPAMIQDINDVVLPYLFIDGKKNLYFGAYNIYAREIKFTPITRDGINYVQCTESEPHKVGIYSLSEALRILEGENKLEPYKKLIEYKVPIHRSGRIREGSQMWTVFLLRERIEKAIMANYSSPKGEQISLANVIKREVARASESLRREVCESQDYSVVTAALKQLHKEAEAAPADIRPRVRETLVALKRKVDQDLDRRDKANIKIKGFQDAFAKEADEIITNFVLSKNHAELAVWFIESCLPEMVPLINGTSPIENNRLGGLTPYYHYIHEMSCVLPYQMEAIGAMQIFRARAAGK